MVYGTIFKNYGMMAMKYMIWWSWICNKWYDCKHLLCDTVVMNYVIWLLWIMWCDCCGYKRYSMKVVNCDCFESCDDMIVGNYDVVQLLWVIWLWYYWCKLHVIWLLSIVRFDCCENIWYNFDVIMAML